MIELKITNSAALLLLSERMKIEIIGRKKNGQLANWVDLEDLSFQELLSISESAAFDLICLLPADIFEEDNNLDKIITKAIRSLSGVFHKEEFNIYSRSRAEKLIRPIYSAIKIYSVKSNYINN